MGYVNGPAATESIAPKIAGLEAPATTTEQGWPGCPRGIQDDLTGRGCVTSYVNAPAATESIAPKAAGLAAPAPAVIPEQGWPGCPWGYGFNPMIHGDVLECLDRPIAQPRR
jgi:hypothetical protein